jgi:hypothetical protein
MVYWALDPLVTEALSLAPRVETLYAASGGWRCAEPLARRESRMSDWPGADGPSADRLQFYPEQHPFRKEEAMGLSKSLLCVLASGLAILSGVGVGAPAHT